MRVRYLIFALAALVLGTVGPLYAEETMNGPVYIVTYFDVAPTAAQQSSGIVREFADVSRKEAGSAAYEVLAEIGRRNRLAIVEAWRDEHAYETHDVAASTTAFREKLRPLLISGAGKGLLPSVRVEVVECGRREEGWTLRCRLLGAPSAELPGALTRPDATA